MNKISEIGADVYNMVTASIVEDEVVFNSKECFKEAMSVGFFRIKAPSDLDLQLGREFAKTFPSNPKYSEFGVLDVVNGYLLSEINQTVRFTLERDNWSKCHVNQKEVNGEPNYPIEIQKLGYRMNAIGIMVLRSILRQFEVPEELWFKATAGSSAGEGSHFLLFNHYNPKNSKKLAGVGAHRDWGLITILDAGSGLQAKIKGEWMKLFMEDGYLTVNFGYPLKKLLPEIEASEHRVPTQTENIRTSTVVFIDPRVGPYRKETCLPAGVEHEGYVYDWDSNTQSLKNGEPTTTFFARLSEQLYGANQTGKSDSD